MPDMSTAASPEPVMTSVSVSEDEITAVLIDGRTISVQGMLHGLPSHRPPEK
jgi:hypothetical protein